MLIKEEVFMNINSIGFVDDILTGDLDCFDLKRIPVNINKMFLCNDRKCYGSIDVNVEKVTGSEGLFTVFVNNVNPYSPPWTFEKQFNYPSYYRYVRSDDVWLKDLYE